MVQARSDLAPVENLRVRAHVENGLVELRDLTGSYHGANVTATGQAPVALFTSKGATPSDGGAVLKATAVGVTSAVLAPFVDPSTIAQVAGSLDARLDLSSPSLKLNDVQGEVVLDRLNLTVADLPVTQRMPTRVVARDGIARIESWTWESEGRRSMSADRFASAINRPRFWRTARSMPGCSPRSLASAASALPDKWTRVCPSPVR